MWCTDFIDLAMGRATIGASARFAVGGTARTASDGWSIGRSSWSPICAELIAYSADSPTACMPLVAPAISWQLRDRALFIQERVGERSSVQNDRSAPWCWMLMLLKKRPTNPLPYRKITWTIRVTHVGRFIRRTSLDELAVVQRPSGDMKLVGPRSRTAAAG